MAEAAVLLLAAGALACGGLVPRRAPGRPLLLALALAAAAAVAAGAATSPDPWPAGLLAAGRLSAIAGFAAALRFGGDARAGALVRILAAASALAAAAGVAGVAAEPLRPRTVGAAPPASLLDWPPLQDPAGLPGVDERPAPGRACAPALRPARLAALVAPALPLLVALGAIAVAEGRGRGWRATRAGAAAAGTAVATAGLLLTRSAAGIVAALAGLGLLALLGRRHAPVAGERSTVPRALLPVALGAVGAAGLGWAAGLAPSPDILVRVGASLEARREAFERLPRLLRAETRASGGSGPGSYAARDAGAGGTGSAPLPGGPNGVVASLVEEGPIVAGLLAVLVLAALLAARVSAPPAPEDPLGPPARRPVRTTLAGLVATGGGAAALGVPAVSGGPLGGPAALVAALLA
ncbi:MAG: hypothetical protein L0216_16940 [Planctomycetales bacterium]|nr:hypothetical protein [Planctomycetales bacterium]